MKKILVFLLLVFLFVSSVSAWQIVSDKYSGNVYFSPDGHGVAVVNGNTYHFTYSARDATHFEAYYWWYTVPFEYNDGKITSPMTSEAYLVR